MKEKSFLGLFCILAWMPALRTGKGWKEYLLFDFKRNARLTGVRIGKPSNINGTQVRPVDTVTIAASNVPGNYYEIEIDKSPGPGDRIDFSAAITARFAKIIVNPVKSGSAEASPIAVNK